MNLKHNDLKINIRNIRLFVVNVVIYRNIILYYTCLD